MKLLTFAPLACAAVLSGGAVHAAPLTPDEALARAVAKSPELAAALAEIESARFGRLGAERARDWVLRANLQGQYAEQFSDTSQGATRNSTQSVAGEVSFQTTTDIGTQVKVGLGTSSRWQRVNQDVGSANEIVLGPTIAADLSLDVTQPLLRGGGTDAVLAAERQARFQEKGALLSRDDTASRVARDVMRAYWDLWLAEQALAVEREGLALIAKQLADVKARAALGKAPETDVLRLASQEAARRQELTRAEATLAQSQFDLARRIGVPLSQAAGLSAAVAPPASKNEAALEDLIARSQAASYELLQLAVQVQQARDRVRVAADLAEPRLDLFASLGAGGIWTEDPPSGLSLPGGRPAFLALVGLDFELPLGDSAADADLAQSRADLRAAELRHQARAETLAAEVATLQRALVTAEAAESAAATTAGFAKELATKEGQRLQLGIALVSELISAQQSQREADLSLLRAKADVAVAALDLDHTTGQLLIRLSLPESSR